MVKLSVAYFISAPKILYPATIMGLKEVLTCPKSIASWGKHRSFQHIAPAKSPTLSASIRQKIYAVEGDIQPKVMILSIICQIIFKSHLINSGSKPVKKLCISSPANGYVKSSIYDKTSSNARWSQACLFVQAYWKHTLCKYLDELMLYLTFAVW